MLVGVNATKVTFCVDRLGLGDVTLMVLIIMFALKSVERCAGEPGAVQSWRGLVPASGHSSVP